MLRLVLVSALVTVAYGREVNLGHKAPMLAGRIIGGKDTTIEEHPYQCAIENTGTHVCGCSLVKPDAVVTAARCTPNWVVGSMTIRCGSTLREEGGQVAKPKSIHPHAKYDPMNSNFDASVVILDRSFTLNSAVQLIALQPVGVEVPTGTMARVTGWGALSFRLPWAKILQKLDVPKVDQLSCQENYPHENISDNMHCFGYEESGKGVCKRDTGSPLVVDGKLVGIVSWGDKCGWSWVEVLGVYCKVAHKEVQDHILSVITKYSRYA